MKASVNQTEIEITLTMTREEFNNLFNGIGNTSHNGRVDAGMTEVQAQFMGHFYEALEDLKI